jgi:hypothetical protein
MRPKTAERLRELAEECVTAAHLSSDEDAATTLLDVASSLIDLANGKMTQRTAEPAPLVLSAEQPHSAKSAAK